MKKPVTVAITGAAGNIGYAIAFRIAAGDLFGPDQPINLHLIEIEPAPNSRIGGSLLVSQNDYIRKTLAGAHWRQGIGHGSALLAELGAINRHPTAEGTSAKSRLGVYGLLQNFIRLSRGVHFLLTTEFYKEDIKHSGTRQFRYAPGIQYFPAQRIEIRTELYGSRSFNPETVREDTFDLMTQVHVWL